MNTCTRPNGSRRRPLLAPGMIALLCFCALTLVFASPRSLADARIGSLPKDTIANHQLRTLDGGSYSLAGMRGEVVVLDFFTTWCGHSRLHIQNVKRLYADESKNGLKVIGLAVEETESAVRQYVADQGIAYPVTLVADPLFGSFVDSRDVSVPQTLVYGRDGRLAGHFVGHSPELAADLVSTIQRELAKR